MGVRLFVIKHSYVVWRVLTTRCRNLVPMASFWGSGLCLWSPTVALYIILERSGAPRATEVLGQEFLDQISPEGHIFMVLFYCGAYNLVPRGTQMPYSAAVDLVAGLGASQVVSEHLGSILGLKRWILDKL
ncbi:hypothetical protein M9H77_14173 [Catharanthus roseus]|uniref:Uncharacterized protein n=1 Tax=Catharanthus roseus TaxID=4058 RepID=A0ACC0BMJ9_CATRO|nr:hypothetical protein M9H77_14173 [Catharanthus roseus]